MKDRHELVIQKEHCRVASDQYFQPLAYFSAETADEVWYSSSLQGYRFASIKEHLTYETKPLF